MLCINEACDTASLLHFCYHVKSNGGLTRRLRTIYLNDPSLWNTAQSQCDIKADRTGWNRLDIHIYTGLT